MLGGRPRWQILAALGAAVAVVAAAAVIAVRVRSGGSSSPQPPAASGAAGLAGAIAHATVVGPTSPDKVLVITFTLQSRAADALNSAIAAGRSLDPSSYDSQFGPDPALVQRALALLKQLHVDARWESGSSLLVVSAPVRIVNAVLGVTITDYRAADGTAFYAPDHPVVIPALLQSVITGVAGLDDWTTLAGKHVVEAIRPGGLTADDVLPFYDIAPLRTRGLDGSGETIVLPEIDDLPDRADLDAYARAHNLPAFEVQVRRDAEQWGEPEQPGTPGTEVTLDLEVAHSIAPGARLIVYIGAPAPQQNAAMEDAMVRANPGAIISDSIGLCEAAVPDGVHAQVSAIDDRAAATGMTHLVASGDSGAFDCPRNADVLSADFPSALPSVTSVGGTSLFLGSKPGYLREVAWGDAISGAGSGGGVSLNEARPPWQTGPGVDSADSGPTAMREVPDVAGVADTNTGWDIHVGGRDEQVGGTSAAAPLWAGIVALIDQDMRKAGLPAVGFANPALYAMAQDTSLSPPPFHDITIGNNFRYHATQGWDLVTGWGTPDVDALDTAWQAWARSHGG